MTPPPVTLSAYGLTSFLGATTEEVAARVFAGEPRFAPPSDAFALPFATVVGEMRSLAPVPVPLARWDTRIARIALGAARPIEGAVRAASARWGAGRIALVYGTSTGGIDHTERAMGALRTGREPELPYRYADHHPVDAVAEMLATFLGVEGPRYTVSTACSSSAKAFGSALRMLAAGVADAVVVAGADSLCRTTLHGFHALGALSPRGTRPFAASHDGITLSEGAGCALLERGGPGGDCVQIASVGESSDAHHGSAPDPEGRGARAAMHAALERAGMQATAVEHVSAHGTGTPHNDRAEALAIAGLLGPDVPVSATKAMTGHLLGAAGVTAVILAAESMKRGLLAPAPLAEPLAEGLGVRIVTRPERARPRTVLVNAFAFGGHNASVLLVR